MARTRESREPSSSGGCGCFAIVGAPFAAICSWLLNHSLVWAVLHALVWPFYLAYLCLGCGGGIPWDALSQDQPPVAPAPTEG